MTDHLELSIMIGTREISGSEASRFKNSVINFSPSNKASSKFTSMILAPFCTCCKATATAPSRSPARIIFLNLGEPVTLVLSPTIRKPLSGVMFNGSSPESLVTSSGLAGICGFIPLTAWATALI